MILISDIHGCYKTLLRLLKKCPDEEVIFLGDLIDRGPRSRQVIEFAIKNKIRCIMGNHDHLMTCKPGDRIDGVLAERVWHNSGGLETLDGYIGAPDVFHEHVEFIKKFPFFIELDDVFLSHTGNGKAGKCLYSKLWYRTHIDMYDKYSIHGHTPVRTVDINHESKVINIDTGCAYIHRGYGTLSAIQWPSMNIYTETYCEE